MKVAVECKSPLMQKSLEMFLQNHLSTLKQCDIVIRDIKCLNDERCFYISSDDNADLIKPFSKAQLILALEARYTSMKKDRLVVQEQKEKVHSEYAPLDFDILERRINS